MMLMLSVLQCNGVQLWPDILDSSMRHRHRDAVLVQMPTMRQVDIRILQWTAVLLVPPRLMDWYVQTLPLRW